MGIKRDIGITGAAKAVGLVSGFLSTLIAARYCAKEDFGIYILLQVICVYFASFVNVGCHTGAIRSIAISSAEKGRELFGCLLSMNLAAFGLAVLLVAGISLVVTALPGVPGFVGFLWWVPFLFIAQNSVSLLNVVAQGLKEFHIFAVGNIVLSIVGVVVLLLFLIVGKLNATTLLISRISSLSVAVAFLSIWICRKIKPAFKKTGKRLNELIAFSYPMGINQIQTLLFMRSDTLMISFFLGVDSVAGYEVARKIPRSIRALYGSVRVVLFPRLSELFSYEGYDRVACILRKSMSCLSGALSIGVLNVLFFSEDIITGLFGERYLGSAIPFVLLSISLCIALQSNLMGITLVAGKFREKPAIINVLMTATNVVLNYLMIPRWGLPGAAVATLVAVVVTNPLNFYFIRKMEVTLKVADYTLIPAFTVGLWSLGSWVGASYQTPKLLVAATANGMLVLVLWWFFRARGILADKKIVDNDTSR